MAKTITDIYNDISSHDAAILEKQAEQIKLAEEEDAAGRIMARGFADELHKLANTSLNMKPMDVKGGNKATAVAGAKKSGMLGGGALSGLGKGIGDFNMPKGGYGSPPPAVGPGGPQQANMKTPDTTVKSKSYATGGGGAGGFKPAVAKRTAVPPATGSVANR